MKVSEQALVGLRRLVPSVEDPVPTLQRFSGFIKTNLGLQKLSLPDCFGVKGILTAWNMCRGVFSKTIKGLKGLIKI